MRLFNLAIIRLNRRSCPGPYRRKGRSGIYTTSQHSQVAVLIELCICVNSYHLCTLKKLGTKLLNKIIKKQEKKTKLIFKACKYVHS